MDPTSLTILSRESGHSLPRRHPATPTVQTAAGPAGVAASISTRRTHAPRWPHLSVDQLLVDGSPCLGKSVRCSWRDPASAFPPLTAPWVTGRMACTWLPRPPARPITSRLSRLLHRHLAPTSRRQTPQNTQNRTVDARLSPEYLWPPDASAPHPTPARRHARSNTLRPGSRLIATEPLLRAQAGDPY